MAFGLARRIVVLLLGLTMAAAACAGTGDGTGQGAAQPVRGGTLQVIDEADVDSLDTGLAYSVTAFGLARLYARQLYSFDSAASGEAAARPVPDLAVGPPDVSGDGTSYTFRLRPGVRFAPPVNRPVVAEDFIYAIERQFDKTNPSPNPYNSLIEGTAEFGEGKADTISGLRAVDEHTLRITLRQPAADFLSIIALPFFAPVPREEASKYRPGPDYAKHVVATGPYAVERYVPGKSVAFTRNPNWTAAADPLRKAWVDRVEVRIGLGREAIQQTIERGDGDVSLDSEVPNTELARLTADPATASRLSSEPSGCIDYLALQTDSGPTTKLEVRQALNYAVDRQAVVRAVGGPLVAQPATSVLPPTLSGHQPYDLYPSSDGRGDPAKARELLARADAGDELRINYVGQSVGKYPAITTAVQASLAEAGITLRIKQYGFPAVFTDSLQLVSKKDEHQIGQAGWCPDYPGDGARSIIGVLLDGRRIHPTANTNFGDYDSPEVNGLIDKALAEPDMAARARLWAEADRTAMEDAAWVPLLFAKRPFFRSARVRDWRYTPWLANGDLANVWLDPGTP